MARPSSRRARFSYLGCGLLMGGADVIPGVSGGTVALVLGIYTRLIASLRALASAPLALARGDRATAGEHGRAVEWGLLIPLGLGILTAVAVGTLLIPPLIERFPAHTAALFLGLVAASLPLPWRRIRRVRRVHLLAAVGAAALAFTLVGLSPAEAVDPPLAQVFASAAVAICAMILPGVSGAYLLEVLGFYQPTLEAAGRLDVAYIATFGLGAVVGLGVFAKVLARLLDRHHDLTMAVLVGLMAGALRALWPWLDEQRSFLAPPADAGHVLIAAVLTLAGLVAVSVLTRLGGERDPAAALRHERP